MFSTIVLLMLTQRSWMLFWLTKHVIKPNFYNVIIWNMKYLFFFKGQPLLVCCVCYKIAIQDFLRGLHEKNKKNLPFHRRIYRRNITRRYFTESCKKITGFCHNHRRIYRWNITRLYFTESCKKITGFCHNHRRIYRRNITRRYFTESCKKITGFCHHHRRNYRRTTHVWHVSVCTNTDGISDGIYRRHYRRTTHVWHVSVCTNTDDISDGITDGSKSLAGFSIFWCEFQLIADGITVGNYAIYTPPAHLLLFSLSLSLLLSSSPLLPCSSPFLFSSHLYLAFRRILLFWW